MQNKKGSILAYSIIILAAMFSIVGTLSTVSIAEKKNAGASQASAQAYQTADTGARVAIKKINSVLTYGNNKLSDAFPGSDGCFVTDSGAGVAMVRGVMGSEAIPYELTFFLEDDITPVKSCDDSVTIIKNVKSTSTYKGTVRAISVSLGSVDSYTKLLIHADGQNNSTEFFDSSFYEKQVTSVNGASVATNKKYFGSGSAYFDGINDYLELSDSPDWNFGTEDFTIEFWELNSTKNSRQHALSFGSSSASNIDFDFNDPGACNGSAKGIWVYWNSGGSNAICAGNTNDYTDGKWHHVAFIRKNNVMTLYVDGKSVGSTNYSNPINLSSGTGKYKIGSVWSIPTYLWKGNLDEIRISKGIARWDSDFTPPESPY